MRALLLAAAVAAPLAASAQTTPADVWPLVPGNAWTYVRSGSSYVNAPSVYDASTWTVVDSVDTAGGRLPRLRIAAGMAAPVNCLVQPAAYAADQFSFLLLDESGSGPCLAPDLPVSSDQTPAVSVSMTSSGPVSVGGDVLSARTRRSGFDLPANTSVSSVTAGWDTADGLGVTSFSWTRGSTYYATESTVLRQATVGGQTVGQPLATRADFWPLAVGNRWEFRVVNAARVSVGEVAWTVVAASAGVALRMQHVQNGAVVSAVTCPVALVGASPATGWQTRFALAACTLPEPFLFPTPRADSPVTPLAIDVYARDAAVTIGAQSVTADVASTYIRATPGNTGEALATGYQVARGIGPTQFNNENVYSTTQLFRWTATLAFARVGGTTYGQQIVAGEEASPGAAALALSVGPNPARSSLSLSFALPEAADATAEIFDALGRSVLHTDLGAQAAGVGAARLDVSGLAPGVYVVRLSAGDVRVSTRISVVR